MNRRNWLKTAAGLLVAPAVVRAENLMKVRPLIVPREDVLLDLGHGLGRMQVTFAVVSGTLPGNVRMTATCRLVGHADEPSSDMVTIRASGDDAFIDRPFTLTFV